MLGHPPSWQPPPMNVAGSPCWELGRGTQAGVHSCVPKQVLACSLPDTGVGHVGPCVAQGQERAHTANPVLPAAAEQRQDEARTHCGPADAEQLRASAPGAPKPQVSWWLRSAPAQPSGLPGGGGAHS